MKDYTVKYDVTSWKYYTTEYGFDYNPLLTCDLMPWVFRMVPFSSTRDDLHSNDALSLTII